MQDAERKRANLRLLQRLGYATADSRILDTATHCVLYEFVDNAWHKADTEGALCVADPPTTLVILNRTAAEPFSLVVQPHTTVIQKEQAYLIVRQQAKVYGLWFPDAAELDRMYQLLHRIVTATPSAARSASAPPVPQHRTTTATIPIAAASDSLKAVLGIPTAQSTTATATIPTTTTTRTTTPAAQPPPPLDKRALQLALLSLMHDERFLELLHAQYTKIVERKQRDDNNNNNGPS